jgi:hypothetical protein
MSSESSIPDVTEIVISPIERDHEVDSGFRRTIEIRNRYGIAHTIVMTSADRNDLEIITPNH